MVLIITAIIVGASGLIAQVLLLRELLVVFWGNELTIGVIFANWIISEAMGVMLVSKLLNKSNSKSLFFILQAFFIILFFISVIFCRNFKNLTGIPHGEGLGIIFIIFSSFLIVFSTGFCHGGLFSCLFNFFPELQYPKLSAKIYAWEIMGNLIGGLALTYLLIPYLTPFKIIFLVALFNIVLNIYLIRFLPAKFNKWFYGLVNIVLLSLVFSLNATQWNQLTLQKQYHGLKILDYRNSVFGNIVVTQSSNQKDFFYNGVPIINLPNAHRVFQEEFVHYPLLLHKNPRSVLIIGGGLEGLIYEALKHSLDKLEYLDLDPELIRAFEQYADADSLSVLRDNRVDFKSYDGRYYLLTNDVKYDVILVGLSSPSDLVMNRFFTYEFFNLIKKRLKRDGIFSFTLPGSSVYLSQEKTALNASVLNALKKVFVNVQVIPGDYNIFIAGQLPHSFSFKPLDMLERLKEKGVFTYTLNLQYLEDRLNINRVKWFNANMEKSPAIINTDFKPVSVFYGLNLWNNQYPSPVNIVFKFISDSLDFPKLILFFCLFNICILILLRLSGVNFHNTYLTFSIFGTGFFSMLMNLVLIFGFQTFYGYVYKILGLMISIFMGGIAAGSFSMSKFSHKGISNIRLFLLCEVFIVLFCLFNMLFLKFAGQSPRALNYIFWGLFFTAGFLTGAEFPLALKLYQNTKNKFVNNIGVLYSSDLLGGCFAGIIGGIFLLPVFGLLNSIILIIILKILNIIFYKIFKKKI